MAIQINTTSYRKDLRHPNRLRGGLYFGYGSLVPYRSPRRAPASLRSILIHTTNNPHGNIALQPEVNYLLDAPGASCHYIADNDTDAVVQLLPDTVIAWHAGDCADNDFENPRSIGIEIVWTPSAGPLPQRAKDNAAALVLHLMTRYPSITKLDMHRLAAVPAGRKTDPAGWPTMAFDAWRADVFRHVALLRDPRPTAPPLTSARYKVVKPQTWVRDAPNTKTSNVLGRLQPPTEIEGELRLGEVFRGVEDWLMIRYQGREGFVWLGQLERVL